MNMTASTISTVLVVAAVIVVLPATGFAVAGSVASTDGSKAAPGPSDSGVGSWTSAADHENATNASRNASGNQSVEPGAMLSGTIGVGKAEIEGEVEERAFALRIANATSNASKAGVVEEQVRDIRDRLGALRAEKRQLGEARQNGSLSEGQYRARIAALNTKVLSVKRLANLTENATRGIPDELLREKGINVTAIRTFKRNASELAGPEVAAIARQIAGPDAGKSLGKGPGNAGPPGRNGSVGPPGGNSSAGPPDGNVSAAPPDQNGSMGPQGQNGSVGPPDRNTSTGPPASPANGTDGNETERSAEQVGNGTATVAEADTGADTAEDRDVGVATAPLDPDTMH